MALRPFRAGPRLVRPCTPTPMSVHTGDQVNWHHHSRQSGNIRLFEVRRRLRRHINVNLHYHAIGRQQPTFQPFATLGGQFTHTTIHRQFVFGARIVRMLYDQIRRANISMIHRLLYRLTVTLDFFQFARGHHRLHRVVIVTMRVTNLVRQLLR